MNQPKQDPFQNLLQAGQLRDEAQRLENRADLLERMALLELEERGLRPGVHTTQKDTVLVRAYGGPLDGAITRVSNKAFPDNIVLMHGTTPLDYAIGVLFTVGQGVPCALVVPKVGGLQAMYRDAAVMGQDEAGEFDKLSKAMTEVVIAGLGYHPGLTYMPAQQLARAARNPEVALEAPTIIGLQPA